MSSFTKLTKKRSAILSLGSDTVVIHYDESIHHSKSRFIIMNLYLR